MPVLKTGKVAIMKKLHKVQSVSRVLRTAGIGAAATLIFLFGVGVGDGRIPLSFTSPNYAANGKLPASLNYSSVNQIYQLLRQNYDGPINVNQLLDGMKSGMVSSLGDPYTEYFSKSAAQTFNQQLADSFSGIGAQLGQNSSGDLIIVAPINGSPASKAGLKANDVIVSINGKSTTGMNIDTAVDDIRGQQGTKVTLKILRNNTQSLTFTIVRSNITLPSVTWQILANHVGYIEVSQFSNDTTSLMNKAASAFKTGGVTSILLDMRGNPGGLVTAAVNMANMWLPTGDTIVQEKTDGVVVADYTSNGGGPFEGMKTAILIDGGTASAAEIVSAALHDNGAATLFGEKSFGKGSVQEIQQLSGGSEVKITVAKWYRPNGQNINKIGITPDHIVSISSSDVQQNIDPQKTAALSFLTQQ